MKMIIYHVYYVSENLYDEDKADSTIYLFGSYSSLPKLLEDLKSSSDLGLGLVIKDASKYFVVKNFIDDFGSLVTEENVCVNFIKEDLFEIVDDEQRLIYNVNIFESFDSFLEGLLDLMENKDQRDQRDLTIYNLFCIECYKSRAIRYETLSIYGSSRSIKIINLLKKSLMTSEKYRKSLNPKARTDFYYSIQKLKINVPVNISFCLYDCRELCNNLITSFTEIDNIREERNIDNMSTFLLRSIGKENIAIPTDIYKMIQSYIL